MESDSLESDSELAEDSCTSKARGDVNGAFRIMACPEPERVLGIVGKLCSGATSLSARNLLRRFRFREFVVDVEFAVSFGAP